MLKEVTGPFAAKRYPHLNLKWTVADCDRVLDMARQHWTAQGICDALKGTRLESTPGEILRICSDAGQFVRKTEHRR